MERFIKMLCKIRSVICSRISFLVVCLLALFSSFFVSLLTPSPANAWIPLDSHGTTGFVSGTVRVGSSDRAMFVNGGDLIYGLGSASGYEIYNICFTTSSFLPPNSYMNFTVTLTGNVAGDFYGIPGNDRLQILDVDATYNGEGATYNVTALSRANNNNYWCLSSYQRMWGSLPSNVIVRVSPVSWGNVLGGTGLVNDVASIKNQLQSIHSDQNEIKNSVNTIRDTLSNMSFPDPSGAIKDASDLAHQDANNQIDATNKTTEAINNQANKEQDRYEQDKQEEADREEQGNEDANKLGSLFTFNVLNPFIGIFDMFLPSSNCASIPTLARLLHLDNSTVCSWFPSDVRNIVTPVVSLSSSMLLFGFIVRWLDKGNFSGGIEV